MTKLFSVFMLAFVFTTGHVASAVADETKPSATAPKQPQTKERVAFGIQTPQHLKVALLTANQMLDGQGLTAEKVDVIACGKAAKALQRDSDLREDVQAYLKRGGRVVACGISLEQLKIDTKTLLPGVEVVPNAFTELVRLQIEGYRTLVL